MTIVPLPDGKLRIEEALTGERPWTRTLAPLIKNQADSQRFGHALLPWLRRSSSPVSRCETCNHLVALSNRMHRLNLERLPASATEWEKLIKDVYRAVVTGQDVGSRLNTRLAFWRDSGGRFFEYLRDIVLLIPASVKIPKRKFDHDIDRFGFKAQTLTDTSPTPVEDFKDTGGHKA